MQNLFGVMDNQFIKAQGKGEVFLNVEEFT